MYVVIASLHLKPGRKDDFMAAMLEDAEATMAKEEYVYAFEIVEDEQDADRLHLVEVYRDQASHQKHKESPHFLKWRDTTADWFAEPMSVKRGHTLFPPDASWRRQA